jgi:Uma2 family endonuclease
MSSPKTRQAAAPEAVPPLENGDRLTREEFERRYDAMPHVKKAELLDGVVHMPSPVRHRSHARPHSRLNAWLSPYADATPGVEGGDNGTIRLHPIHEPQPDNYLLISPDHGGQARISEDDYVELAPELVAEVSASTVSIDLNKKKEVYLNAGVQEYVVWRVLDNAVDWFVSRGDQFVSLAPGPDGLLRSEVFPGLWLDVAALLRGDYKRMHEVLCLGVASPEHAAFLHRLSEATPRPGK